MAVKCAGSYSLSAVTGLERSTGYSGRIVSPAHQDSGPKTMVPESFQRSSNTPPVSGDGGYGHTFFGTGPEPVTVATVSDETVNEDCLRRHKAAIAATGTTQRAFVTSDLDLSVSNSCDF